MNENLNVALFCLKRVLRSKYIYIWLIVFLLLYFTFNVLLSTAGPSTLGDNIHSPDQLSKLKERIKILEESLENSKRNAEELNDLIKNVYKELNDTLALNVELQNNAKAEPQAQLKQPAKEVLSSAKIGILVMSCNRVKSIENHLNQLIKYRSKLPNGVDRFPIIVSQDCGHAETAQMIASFTPHLFASIQQPNLTDITVGSKGESIPPHMRGYFKISRHYKWALDEVFFNEAKYSLDNLVITEDDLNVAEDFFDYFDAMSRVLNADASLYCVSAWNDNGKASLIDRSRPELVHRTDFFPGLGWMLKRSLWFELSDKWPEAFWDDWIRDNSQRKDRACLRPEVSRTDMAIEFAKKGVSQGQFFDKFLSQIVLNKNPVKWSDMDHNSLIKRNYDKTFFDEVYSKSIEMSFNKYLKMSDNNERRAIRIPYSSKENFLQLAEYFDIMTDFKNGIPRTAYLGVVRIYFNSQLIYLAPAQKLNWRGYDAQWT